MSWIARFFLLVLFLSFAELKLLIFVSQHISFWGTMAACFFTGILGGAMVRHQGISTLGHLKSALGQGQLPATELISGLMLFACGILMMAPGFITDTVGFLLLIPPLRRLAAAGLLRYFGSRFSLVSGPNAFTFGGFSGDFSGGFPPPSPSNRRRREGAPADGIILDVEECEAKPAPNRIST